MKKTSPELIHRLSRIEGQISALRRTLEKGEAETCEETLFQLKAATNGLKRFGEMFAREYAQSCVEGKKTKKEVAEELDRIISTAFSLS